MLTLTSHTTYTYEIKKSKFIAHLCPYHQFDSILETLKEEHPKARHFVTAFRYMNEHRQIVEGSSDDGEPKGTSGKPSLAVLSGQDLINIGVIIVRYFGGTKLGTGGLVRAYSESVNLVIKESELSEFFIEEFFEFSCLYGNIGKIEYLLEQHNIKIINKEFGISEVLFRLSAPEKDKIEFEEEAKLFR